MTEENFAGKSAVIVSYKLLHGHPRTTRMALALRRQGYNVLGIGLTNAVNPCELTTETGIHYKLIPRVFSRILLHQWITAPISWALRLVLDDVYRDLLVNRLGPERRAETDYAKAMPARGVPIAATIELLARRAPAVATNDGGQGLVRACRQNVRTSLSRLHHRIVDAPPTGRVARLVGAVWRGLVTLATLLLVIVGGLWWRLRRFWRRGVGAVGRASMPTFPRHEITEDGRLVLRWFKLGGSSFVIELHNAANGEKRKLIVEGRGPCLLRVHTPGEYSWRVAQTAPQSGWSRKLGFAVRPCGELRVYDRANWLSEAFFSVFWPIFPRHIVAGVLGRVRSRIRHWIHAGPDRGYRALEIASFSRSAVRALHGIDASLLIAHDLYAVPFVAWLAARRGIPFAYDAVELSYGRMRKTGPGPLSRRLIHWTEALSRRARVVFAGCPYLKRDLHLRHPGLYPVQLLNGPNEFAAKPGSYLQERCHIPADRKIVLYLGYLSPGRGLETFVQSAALLPPGIHCVAMGPGSDGYRAGLESLAVDTGVADRVSVLGAVPEADVIAVASSAHAGISPVNRDFGNGQYVLNNKLFQYLAAGLPVLSSDVEGVGGFVKDEDVGLVFDERDPASVARAISACFGDEAEYARLRSRARLVADKYCWARQEKIFLDHVLACPGDPLGRFDQHAVDSARHHVSD